jgi:hypothetical protein
VLEAIMAGITLAAIALFLFGVVSGIVVVVAIAVRSEDRHYSLIGDAPGKLTRSARRLNGVGRRDLDPALLRPVGNLVP